jgi:hypothetical protein
MWRSDLFGAFFWEKILMQRTLNETLSDQKYSTNNEVISDGKPHEKTKKHRFHEKSGVFLCLNLFADGGGLAAAGGTLGGLEGIELFLKRHGEIHLDVCGQWASPPGPAVHWIWEPRAKFPLW